MEQKEHHMIPIWFFVGLLIGLYGLLIMGVGFYHWSNPPKEIVMSDKHADVWWGALMLVIGLFYTVRFRPGKPQAATAGEAQTAVQTRFE